MITQHFNDHRALQPNQSNLRQVVKRFSVLKHVKISERQLDISELSILIDYRSLRSFCLFAQPFNDVPNL